MWCVLIDSLFLSPPRHDGGRAAVLQSFLHVRVARRRLRVAVAEGVLDEAEVLRRGVEVRAGAVAERMAAHARALEAGLDERLVDDVADAVAREAGATSTVLNTLMHRAIATGKRVRTETRIQFNSVSVSYAAVELAAEKLDGLEHAHALIFGAGKMAELTAEHLIAHGVTHLYVANRHRERAEKLAEKFGGEAVEFDGALKNCPDADVVVTSTGAPHYVVKPWDVQQYMTKRRGQPAFFIDIAVPRDVDPDVGDIKGITLYNIDALEAVVDEHKAERREEAKAAEVIVEEEKVVG